jgi:hypothetical protein
MKSTRRDSDPYPSFLFLQKQNNSEKEGFPKEFSHSHGEVSFPVFPGNRGTVQIIFSMPLPVFRIW